MAMATYLVRQTLCRERVIRVAASSAETAKEAARQGYGEIIEGKRGSLALLCDSAERERTAA
jgi:hypothetical protein